MDTRTTDGRLAAWIFDLPVVELRAGYRSAVYFDRSRRILAAEDADTRASPCRSSSARTPWWPRHRRGPGRARPGRRVVSRRRGGRPGLRRLPGRPRPVAGGPLPGRRGLGRGGAGPGRGRGRVRPALAAGRAGRAPGIGAARRRRGRLLGAGHRAHRPLRLVAHLESVYLGVLARRTLVANNVRRVVDAAGGKPVLFFADRFDHWATQGGDGTTSSAAPRVATDAQAAWWGERGLGTIPHALIATFGGDTVAAVGAFARFRHPDRPGRLRQRLGGDRPGLRPGVRGAAVGGAAGHLGTMVDRALWSEMGTSSPPGSTGAWSRRSARLPDDHGFGHVRVIVSAASPPADRRLRGHRGPGRLLRRRLLPAQGQRRLHRRRGPARGPPVRGVGQFYRPSGRLGRST